MMNRKKKIKNSLYSYIAGDALGVPFEFKEQGTFLCTEFEGYGTYEQPKGTWSDDTSILLCILDALACERSIEKQIELYKTNLVSWYRSGKFTVNGLFDIGNQTRKAIASDFDTEETDRMGNGALFYSLPLGIYLMNEDDVSIRQKYVHSFCKVTHNNINCFEYSFRLSEIIRNLILGESYTYVKVKYENNADVINTFNLVMSQFEKLRNVDKSLFEKLCDVVNLGKDTDTNAALVGGLLGIVQELDTSQVKQILKTDFVDTIISKYININPSI